MTPYPRNARNRGLPTGLRDRNGYWSWTAPNGKEWSIGRVSRSEAIAQASEALLKFKGAAGVRLADRIDGTSGRTLAAWMDVFWNRLEERNLAASSMKFYASARRRTLELLAAESVLERITTRDIANALRGLQDAGKAQMAKALRGFWSDMFRSAVADGWISSNPVLVTDRVRAKVKRSRLSLDAFLAVRQDIGAPWAVNALNLALVTGQRREDVMGSRFSDVRGDVLAVKQSKTGAQLEIPLALRLDAIGMSVADVIADCRASRVLTPYMIHEGRQGQRLKAGQRIATDRITRRFRVTLERLGLHTGEGRPPSFHEIRSLAKRLYKAQGNVDTKQLLGHTDDGTAELYDDTRGSEWTRVTVL